MFDLTVAATGINERTAKKAGIDCDKVVLSPMNHAGYYPGGTVMTVKVVFEKGTYRLLGAQIVGCDGVDKRIDVLATAMHAGLTALQLKDLDLAYAPPYSSAKDPVNMAGFMIENLAKGTVKQFHWDEVDALPRDGSVTLLDTRTAEEYADGHAEGFINLPVDELRGRMGKLPLGKPVYAMCQTGLRSYLACRILSQSGYDCCNFSGGYRLYGAITGDRAAARTAAPCGMEKQ
ncbi:Coenzyme A disulfide reductase [bioreactor metagenome]|uniref:Coenzyme A disulfide reductase n=1 Tax=bioreactor metagenome TaxID=1076179 RepID=A0A644Y341_9ZZZZ